MEEAFCRPLRYIGLGQHLNLQRLGCSQHFKTLRGVEVGPPDALVADWSGGGQGAAMPFFPDVITLVAGNLRTEVPHADPGDITVAAFHLCLVVGYQVDVLREDGIDEQLLAVQDAHSHLLESETALIPFVDLEVDLLTVDDQPNGRYTRRSEVLQAGVDCIVRERSVPPEETLRRFGRKQLLDDSLHVHRRSEGAGGCYRRTLSVSVDVVIQTAGEGRGVASVRVFQRHGGAGISETSCRLLTREQVRVYTAFQEGQFLPQVLVYDVGFALKLNLNGRGVLDIGHFIDLPELLDAVEVLGKAEPDVRRVDGLFTYGQAGNTVLVASGGGDVGAVYRGNSEGILAGGRGHVRNVSHGAPGGEENGTAFTNIP